MQASSMQRNVIHPKTCTAYTNSISVISPFLSFSHAYTLVPRRKSIHYLIEGSLVFSDNCHSLQVPELVHTLQQYPDPNPLPVMDLEPNPLCCAERALACFYLLCYAMLAYKIGSVHAQAIGLIILLSHAFMHGSCIYIAATIHTFTVSMYLQKTHENIPCEKVSFLCL